MSIGGLATRFGLWAVALIATLTAIEAARYTLEQGAWAAATVEAPGTNPAAQASYERFEGQSRCAATVAAASLIIALAARFVARKLSTAASVSAVTWAFIEVAFTLVISWLAFSYVFGSLPIGLEVFVKRCCN